MHSAPQSPILNREFFLGNALQLVFARQKRGDLAYLIVRQHAEQECAGVLLDLL